jgi:hypothetical protein
VQVTAPAPQITGRLLAVSPDVAQLLAVVTLRETSLGFVRLCPDCSWYISWDTDVLVNVMRKREGLTEDVPSAGDQRVVDICLTVITSKRRFANPSAMPSAGVETGSQSLSHIATDGQSVSKSWCRTPSGAHDRYLLLFDCYGLVFVERPL